MLISFDKCLRRSRNEGNACRRFDSLCEHVQLSGNLTSHDHKEIGMFLRRVSASVFSPEEDEAVSLFRSSRTDQGFVSSELQTHQIQSTEGTGGSTDPCFNRWTCTMMSYHMWICSLSLSHCETDTTSDIHKGRFIVSRHFKIWTKLFSLIYFIYINPLLQMLMPSWLA